MRIAANGDIAKLTNILQLNPDMALTKDEVCLLFFSTIIYCYHTFIRMDILSFW